MNEHMIPHRTEKEIRLSNKQNSEEKATIS